MDAYAEEQGYIAWYALRTNERREIGQGTGRVERKRN
jgi:hypothetical protein